MFSINPNSIHTSTLRTHPHRAVIQETLSAALASVDPERVIRDFITRDGDTLRFGDDQIDLNDYSDVIVIGAGKASGAMAKAFCEILPDKVSKGLILVKHSHEELAKLEIIQGGHPVPDSSSLKGTNKIAKLLIFAKETDLVVNLISGGGSSLLTLPVDSVHLEELQTLTEILLASGATIHEINSIRKHLSQVKGGNLRRWIHPAHSITLLLSDVVGDDLDVIASGPTVPDQSTYADAVQVLKQYHLWEYTPQSIRSHLTDGEKGEIPETPKADNPIFEHSRNYIIGSNHTAALAGLSKAREFGWNTSLLTTCLQGEAREAGKFLASILRQIRKSGDPLDPPVCIVAGGETTVTLRKHGKGGRNLELALGSVDSLAGWDDVLLATLATDGDDGNSGAAGAIVTGETRERALQKGMEARKFLQEHNSYHFFDELDDLIITEPTGTNVNDLNFLFVY